MHGVLVADVLRGAELYWHELLPHHGRVVKCYWGFCRGARHAAVYGEKLLLAQVGIIHEKIIYSKLWKHVDN